MIIIACADDNLGMLFNKRRLSSDIRVIERISELTRNHRLYMHEYSLKLFQNFGGNIIVDNDFLSKAGKDDYCFVENADIKQFQNDIDKIIIYRWNRRYPSDFKFPEDILKNRKIGSAFDFEGNSHKKITEEVYE